MKLSKVPRYASDLAIDLGISKPAVKKHLEKLKEVGIILKHFTKESDEKKQFFCINPDISLSFCLDLSANYLGYRTKNLIDFFNPDEINRADEKSAGKFMLQASVFGDKSKSNEESKYYRELGIQTAKNESLKQLGRALRNIEMHLRSIEEERYRLLADKNLIITRIKSVLNNFVDDPMEREIVFSFFYRTLESFETGISIRRFLEDIFLKFKGSRAGVSVDQIPASIRKQQDRMEELEDMLTNLIKEFKFIRTYRDKKNNEQNIIFDF